MEVERKRGRSKTRSSSGARSMSTSRSTTPSRSRSRARVAVTAKALGIETKFLDTSLGSTALTAPTDATGGEFDPSATSMIMTPAQGDGPSNREGKRITVKSIYVRGMIDVAPQINQAAVDPATSIFIALVQDKQTNTAQLNSEDVYTNPAASGTLAVRPLRNLLFGERFKVLATEQFTLHCPPVSWDGTNIEQGGVQRPFEFYKDLNMVVNFNQVTPTTQTIASVIDNSLHIIAYCSNTSLAPTILYNARCRFLG